MVPNHATTPDAMYNELTSWAPAQGLQTRRPRRCPAGHFASDLFPIPLVQLVDAVPGACRAAHRCVKGRLLLAGEIDNSLASLKLMYGTNAAQARVHDRVSGTLSGQDPIEVLFGHHAEGKRDPTVMPYDRDEVSLLLVGKRLVTVVNVLDDYARDMDLTRILQPDDASQDAGTPHLDVRLRCPRSKCVSVLPAWVNGTRPPLSGRIRDFVLVTSNGQCGITERRRWLSCPVRRGPWSVRNSTRFDPPSWKRGLVAQGNVENCGPRCRL